VVKNLLEGFPPSRFFVSVGLWRSHGTMDPQMFRQGLAYTLNGGVPNIWITPNELMSPAHWEAVDSALGPLNAQTRTQN
jgi:hypothetical protein